VKVAVSLGDVTLANELAERGLVVLLTVQSGAGAMLARNELQASSIRWSESASLDQILVDTHFETGAT
jgi:hypothetical protein